MAPSRLPLFVLVLLAGDLACARPPLGARADAANRDANPAPWDGGFMAVPPCGRPSDYATGTTTVSFGFLGTDVGFAYDPKCLKVEAGATVTFLGDFRAHPLYPSRTRGMVATNPISGVGTGSSTDVDFLAPGFWGYYCGIHGAIDDGLTMAGTIWVE